MQITEDQATEAARDTIPILDDPMALFRDWLAEAEKTEPNDPNAMIVATAGSDGLPTARAILLKGIDDRGFIFYTNTESRKGDHLRENPQAGLCFHWKTLGRQVRADGPVEPVTAAEADAYFQSRPHGSRIGAWASQQSRPMPARSTLLDRVTQYSEEFGQGDVPRPDYWSGYRVLPLRLEYWRDRPFRLHERLIYRRAKVDAPWQTERLFP